MVIVAGGIDLSVGSIVALSTVVTALLLRHDSSAGGAFIAALTELEARAKAADMALVYFAGHGLASEEGNILTPTDAGLDCATGAITQGVSVERILKATGKGLRQGCQGGH